MMKRKMMREEHLMMMVIMSHLKVIQKVNSCQATPKVCVSKEWANLQRI